MKKIIFLILLSFSTNFVLTNKSFADDDGKGQTEQKETTETTTKSIQKTEEKIEITSSTTEINSTTNTEKTFNQKFKEFTNDVDDFMTKKWNEAKNFWDNWDSDENIQFTTFELPRIVIPKITFPKLDDVKFYPIKNKDIFIDITPKNEIETKIITKIKQVLLQSNKITENKETSNTILTGEIFEKSKENSDNIISYGLKLKMQFVTNKNEKRNIVLNVDNTINNKDFISLQNQVLDSLYKKIEKTFK